MEDAITRFENLAFGMFLHFGLYSILGKGEWHLKLNGSENPERYRQLKEVFKVKKNWAKEVVKVAKDAGCRYITLTTRHHDGFSLYDTCGLSNYDVMHSAVRRDLVAEFAEECGKSGIVPFFYHTFADWDREEYRNDFPAYLKYLRKSIELLCTCYGQIGGIWLDGMFEKPDEDWQEDELYAMIRKYQPNAIIVNNSGLTAQGTLRHPQIDCVTFERGKPFLTKWQDRHRASEMCQVLNEHWGYAKFDINYKRIGELIGNFIDCRNYGCNFLLNTGLRGDGTVNLIDRGILNAIGKWIRYYHSIIYSLRGTGIPCEGGEILTDGKHFYVLIKDLNMDADPNVTLHGKCTTVRVGEKQKIRKAKWLDSKEEIPVNDNFFLAKPFWYGESMCVRIAQIWF